MSSEETPIMSDRVAGKVALVTGGGSGIGRASSQTRAREGATVVVTDLNGDTAAETVSLILEAGGKARSMAQDTTDEAVWQSVIASIRDTEGRLDIVLNNAGVSGGGVLLKDTTLEHWRFVNNANVEGVFLGTKYSIELMEEAGNGGSIINISSIYGKVGAIGSVSYNASKGAVCVFSKGAALECGSAGNGVRVNTIHPGFIRTCMNQDRLQQNEFRDWALKRTPIGRIGEP
jgi:NAD(P)-dependent dehydrogenase (short-subunit alcohol dehydrogenase family)